MTRPTFITVDISALKHNLRKVRAFAPNRSIIAMIKANAYGHGLISVANALAQHVEALGVASVDEGITLREAGIKIPIVLMEGLFHPDEVLLAENYQFTLVVHHAFQIELLEKTKVSKAFPIWLKLNTGMHRLGVNQDQFAFFYQKLINLDNVQKPIHLMTHFAKADTDANATSEQITLFHSMTKGLNGCKSLANSAAIINYPDAHADWVRPGLMLYGASPFTNKTGNDLGLKPVMTLTSQIIAITEVKKGGQVGYGGTWSAPNDTLIGVVCVGYGDGYPQFASNGTPVLVNGQPCSLVGRISMDMLTIDLSHIKNARVGDNVVLWGEGLPVEKIAACSQTTPYEILTRMTQRPKLKIKIEGDIQEEFLVKSKIPV